jgi:hypothetical protein
MRRTGHPAARDAAQSHFFRGAQVVYLAVNERDGSVHVSAFPPNQRVFVAARTIEQVERFLAELQRQS